MNASLAAMQKLLTPYFLREGFFYSRADIRADVMAGITVAVVQIPQAMAFALIAGLPAVYGLYASIPGFIASIWGSSRQLSTGPVAVVSLLTFTSLVPLAAPGSPEYIGLAALLAVLVGIIYLLLGLFRFGFIMHLVPQSVIVGFSSAAAAIIVTTQLPTLLGISPAQNDLVFQNIRDLALAIPHLSFATAAIGVVAALLLITSRRLPRTFPGALVVLIIGIAISYVLNLGSHGIALVAQVPSSFPTFSFPMIAVASFLSLLPKAAVIALVGFVGAHATGKMAAQKNKESLDTNQELVGQGLANIVTGFFRGFPISGSFTRTALNIDAGARTPIAGLTASLITVLALLFFTPLFFFLPKTVLAAIVILSAFPLIDLARLRAMYHISKTDAYVAYLTFAMAFILKPDDAIFIGIVAALMLFIRQTAWGAKVFEMGVDREWHVLRGAVDEDRVETYKNVCIAHIGMPLYYANIATLMRQIKELLARHAEREKTAVKTLVLDVSGVHFVDITALETLAENIEKLRERGIETCFIYLRRALRDALMNMPQFAGITVLHNISELKQFALPGSSHTLVLAGSHPEKLGRKSV